MVNTGICAQCGQTYHTDIGHICPAMTGITPYGREFRERTIDEKITRLAGDIALLRLEVRRLREKLGGTS